MCVCGKGGGHRGIGAGSRVPGCVTVCVCVGKEAGHRGTGARGVGARVRVCGRARKEGGQGYAQINNGLTTK